MLFIGGVIFIVVILRSPSKKTRVQRFDDADLQAIEKKFHSKKNKLYLNLNAEETARYNQCIDQGPRDRKTNGSKFLQNMQIRHTHHSYLTEDAVVVEVGGNIGEDTHEFVRLYNPRLITLEPIEELANRLKRKFQNNNKVTILNLGLGEKTEVIFVKLEARGVATSKFSNAVGDLPLLLVNATEFFLQIGIDIFEVDLLSVNCEGCEYEVLEAIISSSLVSRFKNIQFATHTTLPGIRRPIERYCKIQELLGRSHELTYQYRFIWESWRRKASIVS